MITRLPKFACTILLLLLFVSCQKEIDGNELIETEPPVLKANTISVNDAIGGFYSGLPAHYKESRKKYPLLIFLHGSGQIGDGDTDLPLVLNEGVPELLKEKFFPANFQVNGQNFSFIILAPQFNRWPSTRDVVSFIHFAEQNYNVDSKRIYLSGLSMGGSVTADVGAEYPMIFAAIVPISGIASKPNTIDKSASIARANLPVWVFQNKMDNIALIQDTKNFIALIRSFNPSITPKYTEFLPFGLNNHDAWTRATDPSYKENGMNMYEWMLQYSR